MTKCGVTFSVIAVVSLLFQPAIAGSHDPPHTGNEWVSFCPPSEAKNSGLLNRQLWCFAYARGFIDSVHTLHTVMPEYVRVCVPEQAQAGQLTDLITSWIMKHPKDRHQPIQVLILAVMGDGYPCQDKTDWPTTSFQ